MRSTTDDALSRIKGPKCSPPFQYSPNSYSRGSEQTFPRREDDAVATSSMLIPCSEPDVVVDVPFHQPIQVQTTVIEQPALHLISRVREKIQVQEVIKRVPKITVVDVEKVVEIPVYKTVERIVRIPKIVKQVIEVPKEEVKEVIVEVPEVEYVYHDKVVEVPQIEYQSKIVEVPQYIEEIKYVPKIEIVDVPVEQIRYTPRIETKVVEKFRYVPGPVEVRKVPVEQLTIRPVPQRVEYVQHRVVPQDIVVNTEIQVPVPGETVDIPIFIPKEVEQICPRYIPRHTVDRSVLHPVCHEFHIPCPVATEELKVIEEERIVTQEQVTEVEVEQRIQCTTEKPRNVFIEGPRTIFRPRLIKEYSTAPTLTRVEPTRVVHHQAEDMEPVFDVPTTSRVIDESPRREHQGHVTQITRLSPQRSNSPSPSQRRNR